MIKQSLNQKMLQKLSPQQIQLMKLLQIPTATLDQRIEEELEANPALEEGEERDDPLEVLQNDEKSSDLEDNQEEAFELDEYLNEYMEDDPSSYKTSNKLQGPDQEDKTIPIAVERSLHDHLEFQLGLRELPSEREYIIAEQIIGSIDDDGYLRREPIAMVDDLMFTQNLDVQEEEVVNMLKLVQRFDPPGIAASDLRECLLIQLQLKARQLEENDAPIPSALALAIKLIKKHFDAFAKKHYTRLQNRLEVSEQELREALEEILKLNPKPASGYSSSNSRSAQYVIPDFILVNRDGELDLTLNQRNAPDLRVNEQYKDMLTSFKNGRGATNRRDKEALTFIKQKIDSARWFIDAIRQRQQTMYKTMYAILQYQYDFFLTGDQKKLKPMILKDIADVTGLDISTVSRVANSKFVQTEFGTMRLKELFSESLSTDGGEEVSTLEVKNILKDLIESESKRKPLSDQKLMNALNEKGYQIARRTVAKYREQLNIPVARLRKEL